MTPMEEKWIVAEYLLSVMDKNVQNLEQEWDPKWGEYEEDDLDDNVTLVKLYATYKVEEAGYGSYDEITRTWDGKIVYDGKNNKYARDVIYDHVRGAAYPPVFKEFLEDSIDRGSAEGYDSDEGEEDEEDEEDAAPGDYRCKQDELALLETMDYNKKLRLEPRLDEEDRLAQAKETPALKLRRRLTIAAIQKFVNIEIQKVFCVINREFAEEEEEGRGDEQGGGGGFESPVEEED